MHKPLLIAFLFSCSWADCFAQQIDSSGFVHHFSGSASITNNGISLVPNFSLGKPAAIFLLSFGGDRFSVDPDIRFGLDGKPWTFLFWARYKLKNQGKFQVGTGAHLGLNFRRLNYVNGNEQTEVLVVRRYLAGELVPNYFLTRSISIGSYYLYSRGLDEGTVKNTHFVILRMNFSHLPITEQFYLRASPQIYYLNQDGREGEYVTASIALARNHFPLSVSYLFNKAIHSNILGSKDFIWSLSLTYSFNRDFAPKPRAL